MRTIVWSERFRQGQREEAKTREGILTALPRYMATAIPQLEQKSAKLCEKTIFYLTGLGFLYSPSATEFTENQEQFSSFVNI